MLNILVYYLTKIKSTRPSPRDYKVSVNGYFLRVIPGDKGISEELLMYGIHEPLNTYLLSLEIKQGMVCLDIGSNIGYYALLESRLVGPTGKVIAVEPTPKNYEYLKYNLEVEKANNITPFNVALGDHDGTVDFLLSTSSNLSRIIRNNDDLLDKVSIVKVDMRKVDSFLEEVGLDRVDFVRMDLEGYEEEIYQGMVATLEKAKPMLNVEVHKVFLGVDRLRDYLRKLKRLNYEIKYYIPRELDAPLLGNKNDIKRIDIDTLIKRLDDEDSIPGVFHLFLVNKEKTLI